MLKLQALLLTQGMHGMISQTEGLSKALGLKFKHETIKLKKIWDIIPPKFTPITESVLENKFICDSKIIISCGRKSVIPSIMLIPLLAFDKDKNRLGYGKGYYDKYLFKYIKTHKNILTVGVAFSFQKYNKLPVNKKDFKLNFIITEKGIIK